MVKLTQKVNKKSVIPGLISILMCLIIVLTSGVFLRSHAQDRFEYDPGQDGGTTTTTEELSNDAQKQSENTLKNVLDKIYSVFGDDQNRPPIYFVPRFAPTTPGITVNPTTGQKGPPIQITPKFSPKTADGNLAQKIVSIVQTNCVLNFPGLSLYGMVSKTNLKCLDNLIGVISQTAIDLMIDSANNYKFTQCVACAKAMATTVGRTYIGSGAAKQHAGQKVNGYTYYANKLENYDYLVPGSLGISTEGDNG